MKKDLDVMMRIAKKIGLRVLEYIKFLVITIAYLVIFFGLVLIANNYMGENFALFISFIFLILTVLFFVYFSQRRKLDKNHKGFKNVILQIKMNTTKGVNETCGELKKLFTGLFYLAVILVVICAIILSFVFFGWIISGISATTIIIVLLVLILLK